MRSILSETGWNRNTQPLVLHAVMRVNLHPMFDPEPLLALGYEARRERRLEDARDLFAQAVAECRWKPDAKLLARALKAQGQTERDLKRTTTALECYQRAAAIEKDLGDELAWVHTIRHIADMLREQKQYAQAEPIYTSVLEIYSGRPDAGVLDRANAMRGMALLKDAAGTHEEALLMWRAASCLYEDAGVQAGIDECQSHIAFLLGH
jgi:tetratricopeptide (TPR) repeat protein